VNLAAPIVYNYMKKICKKCLKELDIINFPNRKDKKDGLHIYCKGCIKNWKSIYRKTIEVKRKKERHHNDMEFRKKVIKWNTKPIGSRNKYLKEYYQKNKEKMLEQTRNYRINNRVKYNKWCREYYKDPSKRIARSMYNRVRIAILNQLVEKTQKTANLCGCTWNELVIHLEKQFKAGMNWDNYGRGYNKWSIDHIIPCDKFNLTNIEEQRKCFNYTNLQPLWTIENSSKRNC